MGSSTDLILSLRLDDSTHVVLRGSPALEAWNLCLEALTPSDDLAKVMTYLGRRVVAYRVDAQPWRALNCFDVPDFVPASPLQPSQPL